jgi:hypothetical protein
MHRSRVLSITACHQSHVEFYGQTPLCAVKILCRDVFTRILYGSGLRLGFERFD